MAYGLFGVGPGADCPAAGAEGGLGPGYINKIENRRTLPSMAGFFYICEYFGITPQEFFDGGGLSPQTARELLWEIGRLTPVQASHILQVIRDLGEKN